MHSVTQSSDRWKMTRYPCRLRAMELRTTSQLWKEPFTGLDIFTGYRIWKVSDLSGGTTRPAPEDWVQIAEFNGLGASIIPRGTVVRVPRI